MNHVVQSFRIIKVQQGRTETTFATCPSGMPDTTIEQLTGYFFSNSSIGRAKTFSFFSFIIYSFLQQHIKLSHSSSTNLSILSPLLYSAPIYHRYKASRDHPYILQLIQHILQWFKLQLSFTIGLQLMKGIVET